MSGRGIPEKHAKGAIPLQNQLVDHAALRVADPDAKVIAVNGNGNFMWLSAPKPIVPPGTPFAPDLQAWVRNADLDPDWLRIGTDIVGGTTFNAAFSLDGAAVPEPSGMALVGIGGAVLAWRLRRRRKGS